MGFQFFDQIYCCWFFLRNYICFFKEIIWISLSYIIDTFGFAVKFQNNNANFSRDFFWDNFSIFFVFFYCLFLKGINEFIFCIFVVWLFAKNLSFFFLVQFIIISCLNLQYFIKKFCLSVVVVSGYFCCCYCFVYKELCLCCYFICCSWCFCCCCINPI